MSEIQRIQNVVPELQRRADSVESKSIDVAGEFKNFLGEVNTAQMDVGKKILEVASGESPDIHEAMIASEKAGLSFQMLLEFRNKILDSYNEIIRMRF